MRGKDLTKGNITNNILYMSIPVMISMFAQSLYSVVDMIWIGQLSAVAIAGVTLFTSIYFLVASLNSIIGSGSVTVLSQSFGSGDKEKARKAIANTFAFKLLVGVVAGVVLFFSLEPLLHLFTDDAGVIKDALAYGKIRAIFMPIYFSSFTVTTALRCSGDSKSPMYITLLTATLNIILDPLFIFDKVPFIGIPGLGLGVFGAALATVITVTISFIVAYYLMFGPSSSYKLHLKDLYTIDWSIAKRIVKIGTPQAMSQVLRNFGNIIALKFITIYGTIAIAAWGVVSRILGLTMMPIFGLMQGSGAVVGQNIGAKQPDRAIEAGGIAARIGSFLMGAMSVVVFIFSKQIIAVFSSDPNVAVMGSSVLRIIIFTRPLIAYYMGKSTIFTGTGYTIPFLISGVLGQWAVQIPMLFIITKVLNLPFAYMALTHIAYTIAEGGVILYFYAKGNWRSRIAESGAG